MTRRRQSARLTLIAASIAALVAAIAPVAPAFAADPVNVVFNYTGAEQSWAVPANVSSIHVVLIGGRGGSGRVAGGQAARVEGDITVTPGSTLYVEVGGIGAVRNFFAPGLTAGFNGGGAAPGNGTLPENDSAGGGGASDLRTVARTAAGTLGSRLIVAAGGGGGGVGSGALGIGGNAGAAGSNYNGTQGGQPGTQSAGGAGGQNPICFTPGADGALGLGGDGAINGGGGGGGYYGGGGGAGCSGSGSGGGGGSSFTANATNAAVTLAGVQTSPSITITYDASAPPPATPGPTAGATAGPTAAATAGPTAGPTSGPGLGVVDATISMSESSICIELSTATVDFGTGQFGQVGVVGSPEIVVTNCGVGDQALFARGTNASAPGASWDLVKNSATCGDTLGLDEYHLSLHDNVSDDDDWGLGTSNTLLQSVDVGSTGTYGPRLDTACPGSTGAGLQMSMQIIFTATASVP